MECFILKDQFRRMTYVRKNLRGLSYAFLLCALLLAPAHLYAQDIEINETNFPDAAFRTYLNTKFGVNGKIPASRILTSIVLDKLGVTNLKGLELFPELTSLSCQGNSGLTSIDLSVVPKLRKLLIGDCGVTSLDFKANPEMTYIDCSNSKNAGQLTTIDVSKCSGLKHLSLRGNKLENLDVTHNPELTMLSFYKNNLSTINLSNNTKLDSLYANNNPKLTSLELNNNTGLTYLSVYSNNMPKLDVTKLTKLQHLLCFSNKLTELDVTQNPSLIELRCYSNQLTQLNVSKNGSLQTLDCFINRLSELDVTQNPALTYLGCYSNQLSQLDLTNNPRLSTLLCFTNKFTELDLSKNTALTGLSCYNNQLKTLDLSNNTAITHLDCHNNRLTSLTLHPTSPSQMFFLSVYGNALAALDLSGFTQLKENYNTATFAGASAVNQKRRMTLYTDGNEAYMLVGDGIDASMISDASINLADDPQKPTSIPIAFSVGKEANGLVPLKFNNGNVRKRLFSWNKINVSTATITYKYNTQSKLSEMAVMDVTDSVECYLLPMSQEYGTVNLPYDVVLPEGATAYAVSATNVKDEQGNNTATLTEIATAGEIVKANTPMLIHRSADTYTLFALNQSTGTALSAATNVLKGTQDAAIDNKDSYYVLGINNSANSQNRGKLGFWRSSRSQIGNWRAYLDLGIASNAKGFVFALDNSTTGIPHIENAENCGDQSWYTLDGRAMGTMPSQRGVYIHNGKKITISK